MNITVERACPEDAKKLVEVQNKAFHSDFILYGECPSYNEPEDVIRGFIKDILVYKIMDDDEIIGDAIVRKKEKRLYHLRTLAVVPEYWNSGAGTKAIEYIENDNKEALEWELITPEKSLRNHHFYEKFGYKKVGETHLEALTLWNYKKIM